MSSSDTGLAPPEHEPVYAGSERYELVRRLGRGGSGTVYECFDRLRKRPVALKLLHQVEPSTLRRFKHEFRSQADISHRNLVTLYELESEDGRWFMTMELIDGCHIGDYMEQTAPNDRHDVLRQLVADVVRGAEALHEAGLVHRDVKPSNVMVDRHGRAILLDFGLVTGSRGGLLGQPTSYILGTPNYVSPEQVTGAEVTAAADWYGLGVTLYEQLTGALPFTGSTMEVLWERTQRDAPRASDACSDVPTDLDALCADLMRVDPRARPNAAEILERLGAMPQPDAGHPATSSRFVGRRGQLAEMDRALGLVGRGTTPVVLLHGPSGMGKSTLLAEFARRVRQRRAGLVFEGRCFEGETVPFNAFDAIIDELARHLERLPDRKREATLGGGAAALARVFPVLGELAGLPLRTRGADPRELRRRALGELRELLTRLSARRPVVLCIDDLQWGDLDSAAVIGELTRGPSMPRLVIAMTYRRENVETSPLLSHLTGAGRTLLGRTVIPVAVDAMGPEDALALARTVIRDDQRESVARAIVGEADGNPMFICELSRYEASGDDARLRPRGLRQLLDVRIGALPAASRRLLEVIAAAGRPLSVDHGVAAAALEGNGGRALAILRTNHLVRTHGSRGALLAEPYHDQVREVALSAVPEDQRIATYRTLATVVSANSEHGDHSEMLATLWRQAGDRERAALHAQRAGDAAAGALAFERAIVLYRDALELDPHIDGRRDIELRLAHCLANAGHGRAAASTFLALVDGARDVNETAQLTMFAANQLLRVGEVGDGMAHFERVFDLVGLRSPSTPRRSLASLLALRARIRLGGLRFRERRPAEVRAETLLRVDTCWTASAGMGFVDTVRGAELQSRGLVLALRAGDPYRVARALASEAAYRSSSGGEDDAAVERLIHRATELARRVESPHALALCGLATTVSAYCRGRWLAAFDSAAPSIVLFRDHCPGAQWELACMRLMRLWSRVYLGRMHELAAHVEAAIVDAGVHDDVYTTTQLRSGLNNLAWVARGDTSQALDQLERALEEWPGSGFQLQHYNVLQAMLHLDLYQGRVGRAAERMQDARAALNKSKLLYIQQVRIEVLHLDGRIAAATGNPARARRIARRIQRERMRWGEPLAELVLAGAATSEGNPEATAAHLTRAEQSASAAHMAAHAEIARLHRGHVIDGDEGARDCAAARKRLGELGVVDPDQFALMWSAVCDAR